MGRDDPGKKRKKEEDTATSTPARRQKTSEMSSRSTYSSSSNDVLYQEYCELPFTLHTLLVDERNYITRKGFDSDHGYDCEPAPRPARSVHDLPCKVTVKQVLLQYQRKRGGGGGSSRDSSERHSDEKKKQVKKFCTGLALLFDDVLPVCLLYPEERPQYESLQLDEDLKLKRPSEIFGSTFLLRLLVRLPRLLLAEPQSEMDGECIRYCSSTCKTSLDFCAIASTRLKLLLIYRSDLWTVTVMGPMIADLIVLLQKNKQACFGKDVYREPRIEELLPWEQALRQMGNIHSEGKENVDRTISSASGMAFSNSP